MNKQSKQPRHESYMWTNPPHKDLYDTSSYYYSRMKSGNFLINSIEDDSLRKDIFVEKDGKLHFKDWSPYQPLWIRMYEEETGQKYIWWLPLRSYSWLNYRPYVDGFFIRIADTFIDEGFLKGLYSHFVVMWFLCFVIVWLIVVTISAVLTCDERKLIATIQNRHGPARVGYTGVLQPIADAFKMLLKEFIEPSHVRGAVFRHSAFLSFFFASFFWTALPYGGEFYFCMTEFSLLFLILISLLHSYAVLSAGWSSNSKYSFLGGVRTASQIISYDIAVILVVVILYINVRSLNLETIARDQQYAGSLFKNLPWISASFIIVFLAETNRHPYDLPEAEAESVSGYNVEYSSIRFAMFFLAEYAAIVYVSILFGLIFFNPDYLYDRDFLIHTTKLLTTVIFSIFLRSLVPRYRYDQLMRSCWKTHILTGCFFLLFDIMLYSY